ncbi:hypothetical protein PR202_gb17526 [Eleusine coracana subsp. coracana]|uniref:Cyclin-dependent kinase inhibitor domain-containing protein n=1 Tax=Eleusine coracana subsp. coracana TaxID=191504 RepID=A0AAV5F0V8_ELECO|nr:hypothetical protein QOZ80_6BG0465360 [Eleusine coracana subsp. coracana]GJN29309.1 hypothetical protein PR202_gb17526 [Eleusine coracana subsp. coracana]
MGKYIRKCRGGGGAGTAAPAVVVAGVRTRSRSAAAASAPASKRPRKAAPTRAEVEALGDDGAGAAEGCCYLQLRSRSVFMVAAEVVAVSPREPVPPVAVAAEEEEEEASHVEAVAGVVSRCSSTASSSVDAAALNHCAAEAHRNCGEESSVSDSAGCGRREWREMTPSSRAPGDISDQESSKAADDDPKHRHPRPRSSATATTTVACRARTMPPAEEIEEFFAAAEKAEAERFAAKYNFDVVRGVPLDAGGRFEWTPVSSG